MASDLIPPPSPAGRPEPDSSEKAAQERDTKGLWAGSEPERPAAIAASQAEEAAPAPAPQVPSRYRSRFGFVLGALIGVALAAVGLAVVLAYDASDSGGVRDGWSAWQPKDGNDLEKAAQIAEHVAPKYRLGDGEQLVAVQPSGLEVANVKLSGVAMRTAPQGGDIKLLEGNAVMYTLNGLGAHGSIEHGTPSKERHLLVRREALELALYTFRYAEDIDMVVALLPPSKDDVEKALKANEQPPVQALFYRPGDLRDKLDVPLGATIPAKTPRPETIKLNAPDSQAIESLTNQNLFAASFQQGQDANAYLVLDRLQASP
jgi:hypothetical protein